MRPVTLAVMLLAASVTASCRTVIPRWDGKIFAGDSANSGISRKQSNEVIRCDAPEIDTYICMSGDDFKSFYETYILGCKSWVRGPRMSVAQAWAILDAAYKYESMPLTQETHLELTDPSQGFE